MEIETKRFLLFLIGCIGTRSLLAYVSKNIKIDNLPYLGYLALPVGISFVYIFFFGSEAADKQLEWAGDKKIWWNDLRIVHGLNYLIFATLAIQKKHYSWIILVIDTFIGLIAWLFHHKIIRLY